MFFKFSKLSLVVLLLGFVVSIPTHAALKNSKTDVDTVIVTGYSLHSRLLADMIQYHTGQPIIYITGASKKNLFFVPARNWKQGQPMTLTTSDYHNFINFVHPKQVVFIGSDKFVPEFFKKSVNKNIPMYSIKDNDWLMNAVLAEELFGISKLTEAYEKELEKLARGGVPVSLRKGGKSEPKMVVPAK